MRLTPTAHGFALAVKVVPGASRQRVTGEYGDGVKVSVTAPPERGAANEAVVDLLSETLGIARSQVRILRGHANPRKEVAITGLGADEIERRLLGVRD